jgi:hypothetical protein
MTTPEDIESAGRRVPDRHFDDRLRHDNANPSPVTIARLLIAHDYP